jgi:hypothetical protein
MTSQCIRCGKAEVATEEIYLVGFEDHPDLKAAMEAELRKNGIDGIKGLAGLCESCYRVALQTAIEEVSRPY